MSHEPSSFPHSVIVPIVEHRYSVGGDSSKLGDSEADHSDVADVVTPRSTAPACTQMCTLVHTHIHTHTQWPYVLCLKGPDPLSRSIFMARMPKQGSGTGGHGLPTLLGLPLLFTLTGLSPYPIEGVIVCAHHGS